MTSKKYQPKRKYFGDHGLHSRLYRIWRCMKFRCYQKSHKGYPNYGGKGIIVCDEWLEYVNFRDWAVSAGYEETLTIDRIDNSKSYYPSNCRWATTKEQSNNRTDNVFLTIDGETKTVAQWSLDDRCAVPVNILYSRLKRGWDPKKCVFEKSTKQFTYNGPVILTAFGESKKASEWVKDDRCLASIQSIYARKKQNWNDLEILITSSKKIQFKKGCK